MKRERSLFYKKIKCFHCGGNFKVKRERSDRITYLCTLYDTTGECKRNVIEEKYLVELLERRFNQPITHELVRNEVIEIMIESTKPYLFEIQLRNQSPIIFSRKGIQF